MKMSSILALLIILNMFAYTLMCLDKWKAKKGFKRIPERVLFITAFCLGAPGIYLGMMAPLYHKSSKLNFKIGIPLCFILNIASIYFMEKLM